MKMVPAQILFQLFPITVSSDLEQKRAHGGTGFKKKKVRGRSKFQGCRVKVTVTDEVHVVIHSAYILCNTDINRDVTDLWM